MKHLTIRLIIFLIIAVLLDQFSGILLEKLSDKTERLPGDDVISHYVQLTMNEFYQYDPDVSNLDMLFMGSSHAYASFNPYIFDEALAMDSFNLGTAGQNPTTTYYLLEEVLRMGHRPEFVVMETYWKALCDSKTDYWSASFIFHNMKFSKNKIMMFWNSFDFPTSLKLLSRTFKNKAIIERYGKLILRFLARQAVSDFRAGKETSYRVGKGYVESTAVVSKQSLENNIYKGKKSELNAYRLNYLEKIIELAKSKNINIVLVSVPVAPTAFKDAQDYPQIYQVIKGIGEKHNIHYIDYNILNENMGLLTDDNFRDDNHLNKRGVEIMNKHFIEWLKQEYLMATNSPAR